MSATKILWGQVLLVSFVVLAFVWGARTQVGSMAPGVPVPARPPVVRGPGLAALPTASLVLLVVVFAYDAYARDIFVESAYIAASGEIAAVIVAIAMSVWRAREMKRVTTYGSARWAETREVREAGLLGQPTGVLSADGASSDFSTTAPSMSCASRQPAPARAWGLLFRRC